MIDVACTYDIEEKYPHQIFNNNRLRNQLGKGVAGVVGNSSAMIADALHSVADLVTDFVTLVTVKYSDKKPGVWSCIRYYGMDCRLSYCTTTLCDNDIFTA